MKPPTFIIHLRAVPDAYGREPVQRLRAALKRLLRDYKLAAVKVEEVKPEAEVKP